LLGPCNTVSLLDELPHDLAALDVLRDATARAGLCALDEPSDRAHDADPT
jgi:hypothetical protein